MQFGILNDLLSDPRGTLIFFLLAMPGRLLAISAHEAAHAWVADRCGDPTARMLGRVTLNPLKHLDPVGILCMLLIGIGWAKPVPVNPRNYKNYRRDDLMVSLAGITMNLILFFSGLILLYVILGILIATLPATGEVAREMAYGQAMLTWDKYYYPLSDMIRYAPALPGLISEIYGSVAGSLYSMLVYFITTNMVLAVFNLIPVPPLDGWHVLNDTILRRSQLFASRQTQGVCMTALYILMFSGLLTEGLNAVYNWVLTGTGNLAVGIFTLMGLI